MSFLIKRFRGEGYKFIDNADYVAGLDSTLVYETLSRGKKIAIFSLREEYLKNKYKIKSGLNFGWPYQLNKKGPFWSNSLEKNEVKRVLDLLINSTDQKWKIILFQKKIKSLMMYDRNNSILLKHIKNL